MSFLKREVFLRRHERIREFLEREGQEAYVVLTPDNFFYVTGFFLDVAPWERPVAAVIPRKAEPFLVMNELSTHHLQMAKERNTLAVDDVYIWHEHVSSTIRGYTKIQWTGLLAQELKRRGIDRGVLACDSSPASLRPLTEYLPKVTFATEAEFIKEMRMYKSPEELEFFRLGAKLSDYGQSVFKDLVKPGKLMVDVDYATVREMAIKGAEMFPGDRVEVRCSSLSGPASASPHGTGADCDMRIERGHGIVNIIIVRYNGYVTENERTYIVGEPSEIQEKAFRAATRATEAAIAQMVAGNMVSSIDAAAQAEIEKAGLGQYIRHRTGHGLGIAGHEFPEDVAFCHRPLRAGEVWSAEPGIYIYGVGGFRHDDTVIVGETAPEVVTTWSKKIEDQTIPV
ncbi:MAG: M24 family metallopeptidase [Bacillota bacterium]|jgi:Xaa-Pro aminopeptidase